MSPVKRPYSSAPCTKVSRSAFAAFGPLRESSARPSSLAFSRRTHPEPSQFARAARCSHSQTMFAITQFPVPALRSPASFQRGGGRKTLSCRAAKVQGGTTEQVRVPKGRWARRGDILSDAVFNLIFVIHFQPLRRAQFSSALRPVQGDWKCRLLRLQHRGDSRLPTGARKGLSRAGTTETRMLPSVPCGLPPIVAPPTLLLHCPYQSAYAPSKPCGQGSGPKWCLRLGCNIFLLRLRGRRGAPRASLLSGNSAGSETCASPAPPTDQTPCSTAHRFRAIASMIAPHLTPLTFAAVSLASRLHRLALNQDSAVPFLSCPFRSSARTHVRGAAPRVSSRALGAGGPKSSSSGQRNGSNRVGRASDVVRTEITRMEQRRKERGIRSGSYR